MGSTVLSPALILGSSLLPLLLLLLLLFSSSAMAAPALPNLTTLSFDEGYTQTFGDSNLMLLRDGKAVHLSLDQRTGAGFASQDLYLHGFFSASIKLPADYAAGVVVAFYMSNGDVFEKTHDELDFEFLGNIRGKEWRVQTNVYGNGSTGVGREERYAFWFDPTEDFHHYSILWSHDRIIFYIDNVAIREVVRSGAMGGGFPSKPMSLYATIWDGSNWATSGGRYKVNYNYAPYVAEFSNLILHGCSVDPTDHTSICDDANRYNAVVLSSKQRAAMESFRKKYIAYSYCQDRVRYPTQVPECSVVKPREAGRIAWLKTGDRRRRHGKRHHRSSASDAAI